ncbi:SMI1/KNR4 family protein [Pleurocapsales cyanobacterium LEGE 10410]|nr:SMI1/KNR4 family protein [Pleurocapsales cyanobacterium LEGE 10410]
MENKEMLKTNLASRAMRLKQNILHFGMGKVNLIQGCSEEEVQKLEKQHNVIFPLSYRIFLKNFGHGIGGKVMSDIDFLYNSLDSLTDIARNEILIEKGDPILPKQAFVFAMRYGEQFMFYDANGLNEDPPVFYYMEGDKEFTKVGDSIFDIFEEEFKLTKRANKI